MTSPHRCRHPDDSSFGEQDVVVCLYLHTASMFAMKRCVMLQEAAGYFKLLHDVVAPQLDDAPSFDVSTNCTEMLELLMLAQAQESFYHKASRDKKNPAVLARYTANNLSCIHLTVFARFAHVQAF